MLSDKMYFIAEYGHSVTLILLVILSVFSVAFIIERFLALRTVKADSEKSRLRIAEILKANDLTEIENMSRDWDTIEGRGLAYGLRHIKENGVDGLDEIFTSYALTERPRLEKFLGFLATVGSNAPFIGLLGTVFGIMEALKSLASSQGEITQVMAGISQALSATAVGLMVAIPAVVAYNTYQKQVKGILQNLDSVREICIAYAKSGKGRA